ncbi:MAG: FtsX-like permease family protein [Armatimonadetes bacterium]|nr:FtsX-like permease family protein [Armatimonadota bacterium]
MAVVVLRNVMERQSELALLRALGFRAGRIRKLIFQEHSLLLVQGLLVGIVSALVAVFPSLIAPGAHAPVKTLALTLLAVFVSGLFWTLFATFLALRRPLMQALRND